LKDFSAKPTPTQKNFTPRMKTFTAWLCLSALTLSLAACGGKKADSAPVGDGLQGQLSLSGAFALYPLAVKWANDFRALHPGVKIDISAGGAGKGITDALSDVVDLGMVSRELAESEVQKGAVAFAVAKDAVIPTINARNPNLRAIQQRGLSRQTAIDLWITGKVKTWGQVAHNGNTDAVMVYTRSDACGAGDTWAAWLGKKQEDLGGMGVYGDPGIASAVQRDIYGIAYNNIGYVFDARTKRPYAGIAVIPIDMNNNGKIDPDEQYSNDKDKLVKAIATGRYPSPPARDLYLVAHGVPTNPVLKAFLRYVLTQGQAANEPQGFIRVDKDKQQAALSLLQNTKR
jgi:phosphate transport system substrate-binding protein